METGENGLRTYSDGVAIVTGGASGIGKALGEELASRGCEVVLADLNIDDAAAVAEKINAEGGRATAEPLDVSDADAVASLVQNTWERCGRLDYMFNNAGIALNGRFEDFEISHWRKVVEINLMGVVHGVKWAETVMSQQGFGHIVNTASFAGLFPWPTTIPYTATKYAVVGLSTAMRAELADAGIRVSVLCPGTILTPMIENGASSERWVGSYSQEKLDALFQNARGMDVDTFAEKALDRIAKNESVIVLPSAYKLLWNINRLSPPLAIGLSRKIREAILKRVS